jgi:hypothetical protein
VIGLPPPLLPAVLARRLITFGVFPNIMGLALPDAGGSVFRARGTGLWRMRGLLPCLRARRLPAVIALACGGALSRAFSTVANRLLYAGFPTRTACA